MTEINRHPTEQEPQSDEARDAGAALEIKWIQPPPRWLRKLNREQVIEIVKSGEPAAALARRFGVSDKVICRIRGGQSYRDITGLTPCTNR